MIYNDLRFGSVMISFILLSMLSGCNEPIKARFVVQPDLPFKIGDPVFVDGQQIGKVNNLAMDANDCYADVAFVDEISRDRFKKLALTSDGNRLVLVEPQIDASASDEFRW